MKRAGLHAENQRLRITRLFSCLVVRLPTRSRAILFGELLNHFLQIWITGPKAPREPVSAALGNPFAVRDHVELASLARGADRVKVQALLDEGHETRDLGTVVLSRWTVNDFDLHVAPFLPLIGIYRQSTKSSLKIFLTHWDNQDCVRRASEHHERLVSIRVRLAGRKSRSVSDGCVEDHDMRGDVNEIFLSGRQLLGVGISVAPSGTSLKHIRIANLVRVGNGPGLESLYPLEPSFIEACRVVLDRVMSSYCSIEPKAGPTVRAMPQFFQVPLFIHDTNGRVRSNGRRSARQSQRNYGFRIARLAPLLHRKKTDGYQAHDTTHHTPHVRSSTRSAYATRLKSELPIRGETPRLVCER